MAKPRRRPSHLTVRTPPSGVEVSWPWYSPSCYFLLVLYALGLCLACATVNAVREGTVTTEWRRPVLALAIGWATLTSWAMAAAFVNRTTIRVTAEALTLAHGPLYWPGGKWFRTADLADVAVEEVVMSSDDGDPVVTFRLLVHPRDSYRRTLTTGLDDAKEAERVAGLLRAALRRAGDRNS